MGSLLRPAEVEAGRGPSGLLRWSGHRSRRIAPFGCETWKWAAVPVGNRCPGCLGMSRTSKMPCCAGYAADCSILRAESGNPWPTLSYAASAARGVRGVMWCPCKSDVIHRSYVSAFISPTSATLHVATLSNGKIRCHSLHVGLGLSLAWAPGKRSEITASSLARQQHRQTHPV
jgi:hypothetical protein